VTTPPVPLSLEVLNHHVDAHPCDADMEKFTCPCGDTVVFVCEACRTIVWGASRTGTWCERAQAVWGIGA
jgi:hypothetical protein